MNSILCPDPLIITQVAAARALGRRGDDCQVAWAYDGWKRLFKSRYVSRMHRTADLYASPETFADDVLRICREYGIDVVLPVSIDSTEALLPIRDKLSAHSATLLPSPEQLRVGTDKVRTARVCDELGIRTPRTTIVRSESELVSALADYEFPVILKHAHNFGSATGVRFAGNSDECLKAYRTIETLSGPTSDILLQEHVPGHLYDATTVARNGTCVGVFLAVRKLMFPVAGGVTAVAISVRNRTLEGKLQRLVEALCWNGPVEVEFKLDRRDGEFKLIEINPRFWASLATSTACGIDFAGSAVDLAMGGKMPSFPEYPAGVRYVYPIARWPLACWQLARAKGLRSLRDPQSYIRTAYNVDFRDPLPDLFETLIFLRKLASGQYPTKMSDGAREMTETLDADVPLN